MSAQQILVVEDEPLIRLDLTDILENAGYTVRATADGSQALSAIDSFDELKAIITDINLGSDLRGWNVARHARQKFESLAVVYITGDSAAEWSREGVPNSVVLRKPFADELVIDALSSVLEPPRSS